MLSESLMVVLETVLLTIVNFGMLERLAHALHILRTCATFDSIIQFACTVVKRAEWTNAGCRP
jgi:hypothetical protein